VSAWKDLERRVARTLGGERSHVGTRGSDCRNTSFAVECKRTVRYQLRRMWVEQARRQSRAEGKPWLLVIAEHGDRAPIAVMDFRTFAAVAGKAGLIAYPEGGA